MNAGFLKRKCKLKFPNQISLKKHLELFCDIDINKKLEDLKKNIEKRFMKTKEQDINKIEELKKEKNDDIILGKIFDRNIQKEIDIKMKEIKEKREFILKKKDFQTDLIQKEYKELEKKKEEEIKVILEKDKIKKFLRTLDEKRIKILKQEKMEEIKKIQEEKKLLFEKEKKLDNKMNNVNKKISYYKKLLKNDEFELEKKKKFLQKKKLDLFGKENKKLILYPKNLKFISENRQKLGYINAKKNELLDKKNIIEEKLELFKDNKENYINSHHHVYENFEVFPKFKFQKITNKKLFREIPDKKFEGFDSLDGYLNEQEKIKEIKMQKIEQIRLMNEKLALELETLEIEEMDFFY